MTTDLALAGVVEPVPAAAEILELEGDRLPAEGIARRGPGQHRRQQDREPAGSDHRRASRGVDSGRGHSPTGPS